MLRSQRPGQQGLAVGHRRARRPEPAGHVSSNHGICYDLDSQMYIRIVLLRIIVSTPASLQS